MRLTCILLLFLALAATTASADVQPPSDQAADRTLAQQHYEAGKAAFTEGRWATAMLEFKASYDLSHEALLLLDMALTAENQGDTARMLEYSRAYLREAPADSPADALAQAKDRIARSEQRDRAPQAEPTLGRAVAGKTRRKSWIPFLLVGIGGASLVGSLITALVAKGLSSRVESMPLTLADLSAANQEGARLNQSAGSLLGIGLALGTAGGIWLAVRR